MREQRRQPLQKFSQKAPQPPALKPPSTARTAGRSDRAERRFRRQPFILLSFSSSEKPQKRRKRSHTNVSNTLVTRPSTPPAQTAHVRFCGRKRVHTCLHQQDRTQRLTRANKGYYAEKSRRAYLPIFLEVVRGKQRACGISARNVCVDIPRRRGPAGTRSPRCWFPRCISELHGLPLLRRNAGESFHAPCCADSFICAL